MAISSATSKLRVIRCSIGSVSLSIGDSPAHVNKNHVVTLSLSSCMPDGITFYTYAIPTNHNGKSRSNIDVCRQCSLNVDLLCGSIPYKEQSAICVCMYAQVVALGTKHIIIAIVSSKLIDFTLHSFTEKHALATDYKLTTL